MMINRPKGPEIDEDPYRLGPDVPMTITEWFVRLCPPTWQQMAADAYADQHWSPSP
jgi:hypothetical protein